MIWSNVNLRKSGWRCNRYSEEERTNGSIELWPMIVHMNYWISVKEQIIKNGLEEMEKNMLAIHLKVKDSHTYIAHFLKYGWSQRWIRAGVLTHSFFLKLFHWHTPDTLTLGVISCDGCTLSLQTDGHVLCLPAPTRQVKNNVMWCCDWVHPSGCRCGYGLHLCDVYQTLHRCSVFSLIHLRSQMNSLLKWLMFWTC